MITERTSGLLGPLSDEQRLYLDSLRKLMQDRVTEAYLRKIDSEAQYPYEVYQGWVDLGLFRIGFDESLGGVGGDLKDLLLISQELAWWSYDIYSAYSVPLYTALTLNKIGTETQRRKYLPALMAGEIRLSTSISEPSAGSDVSAIRTTARKVKDGWVLNGQKLWNTAAGVRDNILQVLALTDTQAPPKSSMSFFLVPNSAEGVECRKLDMLGRRGTGTYEVFFTDVFVPDEQLVGELNKGWRGMLSCLLTERVLTAAGYVGSAQKVVDISLQYAKDRVQFGKPIGNNQVIAHMLVDMQTAVDAARLLVERAAACLILRRIRIHRRVVHEHSNSLAQTQLPRPQSSVP